MSNMPQRLKIVEPGWNNYTGILGSVLFESGISIEPVAPSIAKQLGCIVRLESCDTHAQVGQTATMVQTINDRADVVEPLKRSSDTPRSEPVKVAPTASSAFYTRDQLAAIADERGIAGIRAIADPLKLRGRGIAELIEAILDAQTALRG